jgi:hypothetical protein
MNRRNYMWKVGGLAVVMVAVVIWLFGCSRESIEDVMEGGTLPAPLISVVASSLDSLPTSVIVTLADGSSFYVELVVPGLVNGVVPPSDTWCYYVEQLSGQNLSHWMLLVGCLVDPPGEDHIVSSDPPGSEGYDGSTQQYGIKWDTSGVFTSGVFCITLDGVYPPEMIQVLTKAGNDYGTGSIAGPACEIIQHNDLEQGNGE